MDEHNYREPEMPQPCDEWHALIVAARAAGRWSARQLARRCSASYLARGGDVEVHVEPLESPVAAWLLRHEDAVLTESESGVLLAITVTPDDLRGVQDAARKARSLLVRRSYATAYCTVLAEEAGATTEVRVVPDLPGGNHRMRDRGLGEEQTGRSGSAALL